jgi:prophage maintenance system killer protein
MKKEIIVYQTKNGGLELRGDFSKETIWASIQQIADLFETDKSGISRHIRNIYESEELEEKATVAKNATVQIEGKRRIKRTIEYYNLDVILSVGYRVNSKTATNFRKWATKTLREHITKGFTLNKRVLAKNYDAFLQAVEGVKKLLPTDSQLKSADTLELVKLFAGTWFSLDAYDKAALPKSGLSKKQVEFTADELTRALVDLKKDLLKKKEASELFGQEKQMGSLGGIVGNVFQTVFGKDAYASTEEKAAHLLYFIVKNHPFNDGNKRSGAFAFVWFLNKAKLLNPDKITPEALTALTLLVAESKPQDKEQMTGLVVLLLKKNK